MLENLTTEQLRQPSLCDGWTVHDIAAHLVTYLRFGQVKLYLGILATAADFDRINVELTRRAAEHSDREIIELLRRRAYSRATIPRSGYDPVLTDLVLHDLDIRVPLGIARRTPEDRLRVAFDHLTTRPSPGFAMGPRPAGLRLVATDTGWTAGVGAPVTGSADSLLLGIGGRTVAFDELDGDGVPLLRQRVASTPKFGPVRRMMAPAVVLLKPPPRNRRSRRAVSPDSIR